MDIDWILNDLARHGKPEQHSPAGAKGRCRRGRYLQTLPQERAEGLHRERRNRRAELERSYRRSHEQGARNEHRRLASTDGDDLRDRLALVGYRQVHVHKLALTGCRNHFHANREFTGTRNQ